MQLTNKNIDKQIKYAQGNTMDKTLVKQLVDLNTKTKAELLGMHKQLFCELPKFNATKNQLIQKIGYRLQELRCGGLSGETRNQLDKLSRGKSIATVNVHKYALPGTKISKEWNGAIYEVEVTKEGLEYQGQPFRSFSAIARKITGTRWNGLKFFGLKG